MKRITSIALTLLVVISNTEAGLITHTDYTGGNAITAALQNSNENAIVNEFNGNIAAANLASNAVTTVKITDANVTLAKLDTTLQSTFTVVNQMLSYRRPVLQFIGVTTVDVEANTGTANQTCVLFPDQLRCVTENTVVTSVNRRFIITEAASNSGTKNSGLRTGYIETANTWYALYAWKVSDVSTDFVVVGDTLVPTQANYAALNTFYGTNSWVYLGLIRNGDNASATSDILNFVQAGSMTEFRNSAVGDSGTFLGDILAKTSGAAGSLTWTYAAGMGAAQVPSNVLIGRCAVSVDAASTSLQVLDSAAVSRVAYVTNNITSGIMFNFSHALQDGIRSQPSSATNKMDIILRGYVDSILSGGSNPLL